jgi:hypothetical protein
LRRLILNDAVGHGFGFGGPVPLNVSIQQRTAPTDLAESKGPSCDDKQASKDEPI